MRHEQTGPKQDISELDRRVSERTRELAENNEELQLHVGLLQHLPVSAWTLKPDGTPDFVNQVWLEFSGQTLDFIRSHPEAWMTAVHPEDRETASRAFWQGIRSGQGFAIETRSLRAKDRTYRWHLQQAVALRDAEGKVLKFVGTTTDIDDQKRAQEELRASETNLRQILDSIPGYVCAVNSVGEVEYVNRQFLEYYDKTFEQLKSWAVNETVHPDDLPRVIDVYSKSITNEIPLDTEHRCRRADGVYRWFHFRSLPVRDANGRIARWYILGTDIEDRKRAEDAVRARERDLSATVNTIPAMAWSTQADGFCDFINRHWLDFTGLSAEQGRGWGWGAAIHPDDLNELVEYWQSHLALGTPVDTEARMRRFDGEYRWFLFRANPLRDESGNVVRWYGTNTDIDDRRRAEEALRVSENNFRQIVDGIPGLVTSMSPTGELELVNRRFLDYYGKTIEEMKAWATNDAIHPDDLARSIACFTDSMKAGTPHELELRCRRADGVYRWFQLTSLPVHDTGGRMTGWYVLMTDIEDRKRAEEELRASENNLRQILDSIPGLVGTLSPAGDVELVNRQSLEFFGLTLEQLASWRTVDVIHPDDMPRVVANLREVLTTGNPLVYEIRYRRADGKYRWFQVCISPVRDSQGRITRWYTFSIDVHDRKCAEDALRASENDLRKTLDSIPGQIYVLNPSGRIDLPNRRLLEYFGRTLDELNSWATNDAVHPEDLPRVIADFTHAMKTGVPFENELRYRRADGVYRWFHARAFPVRDTDDRIARWYCLITDIEDRKRTEDALRASENNFRQILDNVPGLVATLSPGGEIELVNQQFLDYFGTSLDGIKSWRVSDVLHPDDLHRVETAFTHAMNTGTALVEEFRYRRADGVYRWFHARVFPMLDPDGRIARWYALSTDIEDRKRAEGALNELRSELAHMARVSSLGALTASIAHEVNQPLTGILTNADTCLRTLSVDPPNIDTAREAARRLIRDGKRASEVIARLRALFSKKESTAESIDLNEATRDVIALCQDELQRNRVVLRQELANELPQVLGDRVQLQQVILNLIRNASDAMSGVEDGPRKLVIKSERDEADCVRLTVEDTGVGITPQQMERLFEAFYTTKSDGMGIGLSVSLSIIESHHGRLWATPNDGPGATFSFSIPCKIDRVAEIQTMG